MKMVERMWKVDRSDQHGLWQSLYLILFQMFIVNLVGKRPMYLITLAVMLELSTIYSSHSQAGPTSCLWKPNGNLLSCTSWLQPTTIVNVTIGPEGYTS